VPSVTGYVSAAEWLAEAKQAVEHAIECLGQIPGIIVDVRTEMADVPIGRGYRRRLTSAAVGQVTEHLENAEDAVIRLTAQLKAVDWTTIDENAVANFESWRAAAATAADRAGRI
jgi:hypothetical protein